MGCMSSKSEVHSGGHTVLGTSSGDTSSAAPIDARAAAAEAAERRMKAAQARGTNAANPNQGQLAGKLEQQRKRVAEAREEERLVVSGDRSDVVVHAELATSGINVEITSACRMKTLWNRAVRDDEIPASFLSALQRNANFTPYAYPPLLLLSCAVTQHVSIIFIFLAIFLRLRDRSIDPATLVCLSLACSAMGYLIWQFLSPSPGQFTDYLKAVKSSILIFLALISLAPVLRTLTAATSSDSIWALSAILFIIHALLADYTPQKPDAHVRERLTSVLSMNAAVSGSAVLASRLITDIAVFALILFSVQAFALFPILRRRLQTAPVTIQLPLTIVLALSSLLLTASLSRKVAGIFGATFIFIIFLAPAMLIWAQKHKNEIRGPWDVAVPKVN